MLRINFVLCVAMLVLLGQSVPVRASAELRKQIAALAEDIVKNVKNEPVTVGQFTPTDLPLTNAGPGLEKVLTVELEAIQKGVVKADAKFEVKGDYGLFVRDRNKPDVKVIKIKARLIDKETGDDLKDLLAQATIEDTQSIAEIVANTVKLPLLGSKEDRNKKIQDSLKRPDVHVAGSKISATADSPFTVELRVKAKKDDVAQPIDARKEKGQAFVPIERDQLYEIWLTNREKFEAAVTITIDGHDVFEFSKDRDEKTGRPRFTHFIIPPGEEVRIKGWHLTNDPKQDNVLSFLVTEYGQGASKVKQPSRGEVGVLTVTFAAAWEKDEQMPADEKGARDSRNETGFGPPDREDFKEVKRTIGAVREVVSVRYTR
jgi:hypothetical protein